MAGLVGAWNRDGSPLDAGLVSRMAGMLRHRAPDGIGLFTEGSFGCATLRSDGPGAQDLLPHEAGLVALDGRLDEPFETHGQESFAKVGGEFALALWDPAARRLVLVRDPVGPRPLYFTTVGPTVMFASEIKAFFAHSGFSPEPDLDDVARLFFLIDIPDDAKSGITFFRGVSAVRPGFAVTIDPERISQTRFWDFEYRGAPWKSFGEAREAFRERFFRAVGRRLRSSRPVAVSVSGGLDSSSIFCCARTPSRFPGADVKGFTQVFAAGTPADEAAYIAELERAEGVAIERVSVGRVGMALRPELAVWRLEAPVADPLWDSGQAFFAAVASSGRRRILAGFWADQVLTRQDYLVDLAWRGRWSEVRKHLDGFGTWFKDADPRFFRKTFRSALLRSLVPALLTPLLRRLPLRVARGWRCAPWFSRGFEERARRLLLVQTTGRNDAPRHWRGLYRLLRSASHVAWMEWNSKRSAEAGTELSYPFLDRDLLELILGVPGDLLNPDGVPKGILREALKDRLPEAIRLRDWKASGTELENEAMSRDHDRILKMLSGDPLVVQFGVADPRQLGKAMTESRSRLSGDSLMAWQLEDLVGLEFWLRVFFRGGTPSVLGEAL